MKKYLKKIFQENLKKKYQKNSEKNFNRVSIKNKLRKKKLDKFNLIKKPKTKFQATFHEK